MILDFSKIFALLIALLATVNADKCVTGYLKQKSCVAFEEQATAMKEAGVCEVTPVLITGCTAENDVPKTKPTDPNCLECTPKNTFKFNSVECLNSCYSASQTTNGGRMRRSDGTDKDKKCYEACSKCTEKSKEDTCTVLSKQAKAMNKAKVCQNNFVITQCDVTVDPPTEMPECLAKHCTAKKGLKYDDNKCLKQCFSESQAKSIESVRMRGEEKQTDEDCYKSCSQCTAGSTEQACKVVIEQANAMIAAGLCNADYSTCQKTEDIPETRPDCIVCDPTDSKKFTKECVNKCFEDDKDREEGADTDCYRACIPKTCTNTLSGDYDACNFVSEQTEAMKKAKVCKDDPDFNKCTESAAGPVDTTTIPPCLKSQCTARDGFEFKGDCLDNCFKKAVVHNKQKDTDKNCYAGCSKPKPTTEATTTTAAKDKKPSGVDPAVVPSNNQTLGNNSTAAPKPNAPNSNNSTGTDAAIHVGQTLSLARMIFTVLALVMAVKVIAA